MSEPKTLIQCVGNPLRCDDGAGPEVARHLRDNPLPGCRVTEHWGEGTELMLAWSDYARVILVDAAASGTTPGTLHRFDAATQSIPSDFLCYSTHRFGVAEAVEMARQLGTLPASLTLYAIEGECFDYGETLSEPVAITVGQLVSSLHQEFAARG